MFPLVKNNIGHAPMHHYQKLSTFQTVMEQAGAYIVIEVLIAILALFNNGLVLVAIYKFKRLHTCTYWLIGSLAWADVGVAVLAIPSGIVLRLGKNDF